MKPDFEIEHLNPRELSANPLNFRRHPDLQRQALAGSLSEHGWLAAPIWNKRSGHLLDGHARVELAVEQSEALIPVRVIDVPLSQEKRILRAFDRIGGMAEEDSQALDRLIEDIGDVDLERLLGEITEPESGLLPEADPDAIPEVVETRAKAGDLWLLGEHRLLCGDCTVATDVERLFGEKHLRMVWTDPPYGVSYQDNESVESLKARNRRTDGKVVANDAMSESDTEVLVQSSLLLALEHSAKGASCYVACPPGTLLPHFIAAVAASGFVFKHSLVWVKDQFVFGRCDYHYRHEIILYGWKEGAHFFADDRTRDSVFEVDRPKRSEEHPTMKPVELVRQMVENSSRPSEIVYDPFLGSGTTILACEALGRACYGCEISPEYADVVIARWEQATGKSARLA